jgi:hypothetical protein
LGTAGLDTGGRRSPSRSPTTSARDATAADRILWPLAIHIDRERYEVTVLNNSVMQTFPIQKVGVERVDGKDNIGT